MKTLKSIPAILAGAGLILALDVSAGGMPELAKTCAICHGENGLSDEPEVPIIAGASGFFLENQIAVFAEEARPCEADFFKEEAAEPEHDISAEDHCALAAEVSDDEMVELAEYFAGEPFEPAQQEVDAALADQGASIHAGACERCHTEGGSLALDDAGILAGQWKPYLMEQMEYYKAGERWQPEKMQPEMEKLSEDDMKALAEFYAREGLQRAE